MKLKELKLKKISINKEAISDVLKATLISVIISLIAVLVFGIVLKFVDVGDQIVMPVNQIIKVLSVLFGCIFGIKRKSGGVLKGTVVGVVYTLLSIFIFWIVVGSLKGSFGIVDFISGIITGAVSGIIAVNTGRSRA